jgi:hypothetical protein
MLAIIFHQSGLIWQRCGAEFWQGTCSSHICEISLHMHNMTDTILKRHKSLDILSYVFLPFYDRDKSNIADETNVDTIEGLELVTSLSLALMPGLMWH